MSSFSKRSLVNWRAFLVIRLCSVGGLSPVSKNRVYTTGFNFLQYESIRFIFGGEGL